MRAATEALGDIRWRMWRCGVDERQDGDEIPTLETIGRLFSVADEAKWRVGEMQDLREGISEALSPLDDARVTTALD
jgi:hypothetical protein